MKSYFIVENLLQTIFSCNYISFFIQKYDINGVDTRTADFISENPMVFKDINSYFPSKTLYNGTPYQPDNFSPNQFNPFPSHFNLDYATTVGIPSGYPTGTTTGSNYGYGMMQLGIDKPIIYNENKQPYGWAFFLDIEYNKSLDFRMDIIAYANSQGEPPIVYKTLFIFHDPVSCISRFVIGDNTTGLHLEFNHLGFLNGLNPIQPYDGPIPIFGDYIAPPGLESANVKVERECGEVPYDGCILMERTRSFAIRVKPPLQSKGFEDEFKECCYQHIVLADGQSTDDYKNDYSGFYYQRQGVGDNCEFVLKRLNDNQEYPLNSSTYGQIFNFGSFITNTNLKGYRVDWRKVLLSLGEGEYQIIKRINFLGSVVEQKSIVFSLRQFNTMYSDKTIRMDIVMNGWIEKDMVMFKGTNWKHSLRLPGFFGRREPKYEEDILVNRSYEKKQISMKQTNEYKFQTNMIPDCLTNEIWDFMLYANEIYMNDYNLNNHSYDYVKFGVRFSNNDGSNYFVKSRKNVLNLTFTDQLENNIKRNY